MEKEFITSDSDYWFIDANALTLYDAKDEIRKGLCDSIYRDDIHQNIPYYNSDAYQEKEILEQAPGTDIDNWIKFMDQFPEETDMVNGKKARWNCTVALVNKETKISQYEYSNTQFLNESFWGSIVLPPRGNNGFGFDSRFVPENTNKTYAEMDLDEKNYQSARARGILDCLYWLVLKEEFQKIKN